MKAADSTSKIRDVVTKTTKLEQTTNFRLFKHEPTNESPTIQEPLAIIEKQVGFVRKTFTGKKSSSSTISFANVTKLDQLEKTRSIGNFFILLENFLI